MQQQFSTIALYYSKFNTNSLIPQNTDVVKMIINTKIGCLCSLSQFSRSLRKIFIGNIIQYFFCFQDSHNTYHEKTTDF